MKKLPCLLAALLAASLSLAALSCSVSGKGARADAHFKLGNSYLVVGENQAAFVEFQKALELDPRNEKVHNAIGVVYLNLDDYGKAREYFANAVRLDPSFSEAFNNLCFASYSLKRWSDAVEACRKALENPLYLTPEKAYYNMARAYYRMGEYRKAEEAYEDAIKRFPREAPNRFIAYYGLALAYNALEMYGKAASTMAKAVRMDPAFEGDINKAEEAFRTMEARTAEEQKDFRDLIEILRY
ncbi:MAG: hypothetical protein Kow0025_14760 [Thermodesulfovibrionales bacterium]